MSLFGGTGTGTPHDDNIMINPGKVRKGEEGEQTAKQSKASKMHISIYLQGSSVARSVSSNNGQPANSQP